MSELAQGGWMMLPLAICSVTAVMVILERGRYFFRLRQQAAAEDWLELVRAGDREKALAVSADSQQPLLRVLAAGLANPRQAVKEMEATGILEIGRMKRGLSVLDTIITLSPLLGLLGTIIGMIQAFHIMGDAGLGQPHAITGGVAEALIATAAGIAVAVLALVPHNYFLRRVECETEVMEHYATRLELLLQQFGGQK